MGDGLITILNQNSEKFSLNQENLRILTEEVLGLYSLRNYELTVSIVNEDDIHQLNNEYRSKDKPTDVLSFPQTSFSEPISRGITPSHEDLHNVLGDIVICLEIAKANADSIGHSLGRELAFLITHGILHLGGHDHHDPEEEEIMISEQKFVIDFLTRNLSDQNFSNIVKEMV